MTAKIFLNYRRSDSKGFAFAIHTILEQHYHKDQIFMDVDTLLPGVDFVQALEEAVETCDIFLAIIGPKWISTKNQDGTRRIDDPEDFVRIEIAHALKRGIPVIPVLVNGAQMPSESNLPDTLKSLARRHAYVIGDYLRTDVERLISVIDTTYKQLASRQLDQVQSGTEPQDSYGKAAAESSSRVSEKKARTQSRQDTHSEQDSLQTAQKPLDSAPIPHQQSIFSRVPVWGWGLLVIALALIGYAEFEKFPFNPPVGTTTSQSERSLNQTEGPARETDDKTKTQELFSTPEPQPTASETPHMDQSGGDANMVFIPAGEFVMGAEASQGYQMCLDVRDEFSFACQQDWFEDENPVHTVDISAFWIDQTEVTNGMYRLCVEEGFCVKPKNTKYYEDPSYEEFPVVFVTWNDANSYCRWMGYRLPTEAEWEKASRGTSGSIFPWGDHIDKVYANYSLASTGLVPGGLMAVGSYEPGASPYNVFDMAGNAAEWVADHYDPAYYLQSPDKDPSGPDSGDQRVLRGGSWSSYADGVRTTNRGGRSPESSDVTIGFRCAADDLP